MRKVKFIVKSCEIKTGKDNIVFISPKYANLIHVKDGEIVWIKKDENKKFGSKLYLDYRIEGNFILIPKILMEKWDLDDGDEVEIFPVEIPDVLSAIKRKLYGKKLSEEEVFNIVKSVVNGSLSSEGIAFFVSGYTVSRFSMKEAYYLTKAMVETGEKIIWEDKYKPVLDKHSIGGIPANRISMIIVPIVASLGYTIPKTASRAITSPAGTADAMEVLANVTFTAKEIKRIVEKTRGCIVWGGGSDLAPADDIMISVRHILKLDPQILVLSSILAKKVAAGSEYMILELPYGPSSPKAKKLKDISTWVNRFIRLASKFGIKVYPFKIYTTEPVGKGVGPLLEARDALRVLMREEERPIDLEFKSVIMSTHLVTFAKLMDEKEALKEIREKLESKEVYKKMKEIIKAQGGDPNIKPKDLKPAKIEIEYKSKEEGYVEIIYSKDISEIARIAGAPFFKDCGIYLEKKVGDYVRKGDVLFKVYTNDEYVAKVIEEELRKRKIYEIRHALSKKVKKLIDLRKKI